VNGSIGQLVLWDESQHVSYVGQVGKAINYKTQLKGKYFVEMISLSKINLQIE
jgi:hypothetical protein